MDLKKFNTFPPRFKLFTKNEVVMYPIINPIKVISMVIYF